MELQRDFSIRRLRETDRSWVLEIVRAYWGAEVVVVHDEIFYPHQLPGFVVEGPAGSKAGLVTYQIQDAVLEIITLNSFKPGCGIGSALMAAVHEKARDSKCARIRVTATNDNHRAIDFYRRRGYALREIRKGAVDQARKIKPSIPEFSPDGIRISDEVEFEYIMKFKNQ